MSSNRSSFTVSAPWGKGRKRERKNEWERERGREGGRYMSVMNSYSVFLTLETVLYMSVFPIASAWSDSLSAVS